MSKLKVYDGTNWKVVNGQITGDTLPIGSIIPFGGTTVPSGWFLCHGQELSRASYPELYAAIGDAFGGDDERLTFNLPNFKGKVPVGRNSSDTDFEDIGDTGGSKELQSHSHTIVASTQLAGLASGGTGTYIGTGTTYTSVAGTGNSGNLQPYIVTEYIIKYKNTVGLVGNVNDNYSTSHVDSYSCDYVNDLIKTSQTSSNADTYSCNYIDNTYGRHTLYIDAGGTSGQVTLSENASNYSYLEVYYYADARHDSIKIPTSVSNFSLNLMYTNIDNHIQYIYTTDCTLSGNKINQNVARNNFIASDNTISSYGNTPYIKIYRVIGYK